jgi:hypothetical protein
MVLREPLMGDAGIMGMSTALQSDPHVQAALADPELMRLVASGNLGALQSNPRFKAQMKSPGSRAVQRRMIRQQSNAENWATGLNRPRRSQRPRSPPEEDASSHRRPA